MSPTQNVDDPSGQWARSSLSLIIIINNFLHLHIASLLLITITFLWIRIPEWFVSFNGEIHLGNNSNVSSLRCAAGVFCWPAQMSCTTFCANWINCFNLFSVNVNKQIVKLDGGGVTRSAFRVAEARRNAERERNKNQMKLVNIFWNSESHQRPSSSPFQLVLELLLVLFHGDCHSGGLKCLFRLKFVDFSTLCQCEMNY